MSDVSTRVQALVEITMKLEWENQYLPKVDFGLCGSFPSFPVALANREELEVATPELSPHFSP